MSRCMVRAARPRLARVRRAYSSACPRGKPPCASGAYSTQEAGTRSPYVQHGGPIMGARVSVGAPLECVEQPRPEASQPRRPGQQAVAPPRQHVDRAGPLSSSSIVYSFCKNGFVAGALTPCAMLAPLSWRGRGQGWGLRCGGGALTGRRVVQRLGPQASRLSSQWGAL
eukprot:scaffold63078_cov66-Phaeocystis_antarctica.AAC.2